MKKILKKASEINQLDDYFVLNCYKCKSGLYLQFIESAGLFTVTCDQCKIICSSGVRPTKMEAVEAWNDFITAKETDSHSKFWPSAPPIEAPIIQTQTQEWVPITPGGKQLNELIGSEPEEVWWALKEHYGTLYKSVEALRKAGYKVVNIPF